METYKTFLLSLILLFILLISFDTSHIAKSLAIIASPPHSITPQASAVDSIHIVNGYIYVREDSEVIAYPIDSYQIKKK